MTFFDRMGGWEPPEKTQLAKLMCKNGVDWDIPAIIAEIKNGADVNQNLYHDNPGVTPLYQAVFWGHYDVVKVLLDHGANPRIFDSAGQTPLIQSIVQEYPNIATLLIDTKRGISQSDDEGNAPLMFAAERGHIGVITKLVGAGAKVNAKNKTGVTPLMFAAHHGHMNIVRVLIRAGADLHARSDTGHSAQELAIRKKNFEIADYIKNTPKRLTRLYNKKRAKTIDKATSATKKPMPIKKFKGFSK